MVTDPWYWFAPVNEGWPIREEDIKGVVKSCWERDHWGYRIGPAWRMC